MDASKCNSVSSDAEEFTIGDDGDKIWSHPSASPREPCRLAPRLRRAHRKSRNGCLICKQRRVKCDEIKPSCTRCHRHGVPCRYQPAGLVGRNRTLEIVGENAAPSGDMFSMALSSAASSVNQLLQEAGDPFPVPSASDSGRTHLNSLRHFELFTSHTMGAPIARHIIRSQVLALALSSPHLMHALIAISRAHLNRLVPSCERSRSEEYHHWERAVALFQHETTLPVSQHNMNAVISTCMMLSILAFTCDDTTTSSSWIFSGNRQATNWLYVQGGLPTILSKYQGRANNNIWAPVINDADDHHGTFSDEKPGADGISSVFVELCEIDENSNEQNHPYHPPLRALANLQKIKPSSLTFTKLVTFVGKVKSGYRDLLQRKDPRALLILSYWFAMMCSVDQWWIQTRVRFECASICRFLEHTSDDRIQQLLQVPARACGYLLNYNGET
ncbi:hypothetical protein AJ78_04100 [Emergomyces pasteurianus Ep9510]|uniref:Zn(2)-C6 fungal-type domain-containing protein n=1 Tax=Emergomyces pasteurianus Ep9510 TaxID=1447872 RepID=A0A1J9PIF3_9EURO|nr:hypothetical protein AJ78_04100 [Emergomyces pasteurianus Ep9510]